MEALYISLRTKKPLKRSPEDLIQPCDPHNNKGPSLISPQDIINSSQTQKLIYQHKISLIKSPDSRKSKQPYLSSQASSRLIKLIVRSLTVNLGSANM
jgi:hypothetical protein